MAFKKNEPHRDISEYADMIDLPHHVSTKHPQMDRIDRAAQFSPFAALTGHEEAIEETARITDQWVELEESARNHLDQVLALIYANLEKHPLVVITYFVPDEKKAGGRYEVVRGRIRKIDAFLGKLILEDQREIMLARVHEMEYVQEK